MILSAASRYVLRAEIVPLPPRPEPFPSPDIRPTSNQAPNVVPEALPALPPVIVEPELPKDFWKESWEKARALATEQLSEADNEFLDSNIGADADKARAANNFDFLYKTAKDAKDLADKKRYSYTKSGKIYLVSNQIGACLKVFDKYAIVVDACVQHSPQITALVWGGIRLMMKV